MIEVNFYVPISLTHKICPFLYEKRKGVIININSLAGRKIYLGGAIYCATKWGLRSFTDSLRIEAEPNNIKIMGVYPGRMKTRENFTTGLDPREVANKIYQAHKNLKLNDLILDT